MQVRDIVKVEGNGLNQHARVECIPNSGPRAVLGHVCVLATNGMCYWVESKNCAVVWRADTAHATFKLA